MIIIIIIVYHSLADRIATLQLQSSGTRFRHGCTLPPLVVDNYSEMDLKLTSSYKPTHDPLRTVVLTVYLLTHLLTYRVVIVGVLDV